MPQRFVTAEIPAHQLRPGDLIIESESFRHERTLTVKSVTRYSKHATYRSKFHHTGCYGVHVNGSNCWDADALVKVTRDTQMKTA